MCIIILSIVITMKYNVCQYIIKRFIIILFLHLVKNFSNYNINFCVTFVTCVIYAKIFH